MRQLGPLFGISHSAVHRVIDTIGPLLALAPVRHRPKEQVAIVDGTLIPTRDHRSAAQGKNYRYSTNLQVAIDANCQAPGLMESLIFPGFDGAVTAGSMRLTGWYGVFHIRWV
jgi:hypothetical protein